MKNKKDQRDRPLRELTLDERRRVLLDDQIMRHEKLIKKYRISTRTLGHIRYFHGNSNAKANHDYYKDLLCEALHPSVIKIKQLRAEGYTSLEVANLLKIELEIVNNNW